MVLVRLTAPSLPDRSAWDPFHYHPSQRKLDEDSFAEIPSNLGGNAADIEVRIAGNLERFDKNFGSADLDFEEAVVEVEVEDEDDDDDEDSFSVLSDDGLTKNIETGRLLYSRKQLWAYEEGLRDRETVTLAVGGSAKAVKIKEKTWKHRYPPTKLSPDIFNPSFDDILVNIENFIDCYKSGSVPVTKLGGFSEKSVTAKHESEIRGEEWNVLGYYDGMEPHKASDEPLQPEWEDLAQMP
ncbi:hypothetical protein CMQ_7057 [Grosmannia clavigera kw1407]|uniref:Uncharacterized protein n=1 Tax=Grosmannia clavigera (strain kw1407 / UAMH 11150) TaxID=655863 RepID=F0XQA9_GROCL|nr:uncharacterized protein CMQ_7057 [Grosmannia clavigera kw1407]EFX00055.1 hypothetical protein CMQ_7057 [Grosmannia clavigera kw1407]